MARLQVKNRKVRIRPNLRSDHVSNDDPESLNLKNPRIVYSGVTRCSSKGICPIKCLKVSYDVTIKMAGYCRTGPPGSPFIGFYSTLHESGSFVSAGIALTQTEVVSRCRTYHWSGGCDPDVYPTSGEGCLVLFLNITVWSPNDTATGKYQYRIAPLFSSIFDGIFRSFNNIVYPAATVVPQSKVFDDPTEKITFNFVSPKPEFATTEYYDQMEGTITIQGSLDPCCNGYSHVTTECASGGIHCGTPSSSSSSDAGNPCRPSCVKLGSAGTYVAEFTGTLLVLCNDTINRFFDNSGFFTLSWNGTDIRIDGTNSGGVPLPVTAGTSYAYTATGSIPNGAGYTFHPNGDGASNSVAWDTVCVTAPYGALIGVFTCAVIGSSSGGGDTPPGPCDVPGDYDCSEITAVSLSANVFSATCDSDGHIVETDHGPVSLTLTGGGGTGAAGGCNFLEADGVALPGLDGSHSVSLTLRTCDGAGSIYEWLLAIDLGASQNPANVKTSGDIIGTGYSGPVFQDPANTFIWNQPMACPLAGGTVYYFRNVVVS